MNNIHKLNGFIYVTSEEKPKENQYGIGYAVGFRGIGAKYYLFFHDGSSMGKINSICEHASTVILTNDHNLTNVQQLTPEEEAYCKTVDSVEVEKEKYSERFDTDKSPIGNYETWGNRYKLQLPKLSTKLHIGEIVDESYPEEFRKKETIEEVANKRYSVEYICNGIDIAPAWREGFIDGYNEAVKTLYTEEEVRLMLSESFKASHKGYYTSADKIINQFNQNKKK